MSTLAEMVVRIGADASRLKRGLGQASADINRFTKRTQTAGMAMQQAGKASMKGGMVIAAGLGLAVKTGMKFDRTMSTVRAATGASTKDFEKLRKAALKWGATTQFSATKVAEAMVEMGKAGFNTQQTMKAMPGVLAAAAASGESMATVSTIMVDTLTGFGMAAGQATKVADALAYSANATTGSIGDFGEALKYVAPVAKAAGVSFDETNGALVALAKVGIKGSMAGTSLRATLLSMQAPNKRITKQMKDMGLSFRDAQGNMRPLAANIDTLKGALSKMSKSEADTFLARAFGKENSAAIAQFLEIGGKGLRKFEKQSLRSKGAAKKFADVLRDNLAGSMENMGGAAETAAINISDDLTPAIKGAVGEVTKLLAAYSKLDPATRRSASQLMAATAVFLTVAGAVGIVGGTVVRGVGMMAKAFTPLLAALRFVGAPVLLMVRSLGDLGVALKLIATESGAAKMLMGIGRFALGTGRLLAMMASAVVTAVGAIAAAIGAPVVVVVAAVVAIGAAAVLLVVKWRAVVGAVRGVWGQIKSAFQQGWSAVTNLTAGRVGYLVGYVATRIALLPVTIAVAMGRAVVAVAQAVPGAVAAAARFASGVVRSIGSGLKKLPGIVMDALKAIGPKFAETASWAAEQAKAIGVAIVQGIASGIKSAPGLAADAARGVVKGALKAARDAIDARSPSRKAAELIGLPFSQGIAAGITAGGGGAAQAAANVAQRAIDAAQAKVDAADRRRNLTKALGMKKGERGRTDAIQTAKEAIRMAALAKVAARAQAKVDKLTAAVAAFATAESLASAGYSLAVTLSGGQASLAQQQGRIAGLTAQYTKLAAFLQKNAKKLSADARSGILSQLQGLAQEMSDIHQAIADAERDRVAGVLSAVSSTNGLADAQYNLAVALNGGTASMAQMQGRLASLANEYAAVNTALNSNTLDIDQQTGLLNDLAGIANEMNQVRDDIRDATGGGTGGTSGATGGSSGDSSVTQAYVGKDGVARVVVHQNFIGPNVDHFTASRDALFSYQTAGMAPA